jgi:glycerol-3-phosphate dehydrogenase (NAD(P)+)
MARAAREETVTPGARVAVLGGGAWGTALAIHVARLGHPVALWMREPDLVARMAARRDNPLFLPGVLVPEGVTPTDDLGSAVRDASLAMAVVPTPHARDVYRRLAPFLDPRVPVLLAAKGIEEASLALPLEVASQELGAARPAAILSGPSFAPEVARGVPTAVVVASRDYDLAVRLRDLLSSPTLRFYANADIRGVQLAGALKNVIAIAAGVLDGLGLGHNVLAALITRGLAEITRLGTALGADPTTFSGLAGLGDLVLTCTGALSRNRRVGQAIGRGERLEDILSRSPSVAEGVRTTPAARALARRAGVEMPIVEEVHRILFENGSPADAVARLMIRPLGSEDGTTKEPPS